MKIIRISILTKKLHERDIPVTTSQLLRWQNGEYIQVAMPHLSADDREFILDGITPEEWREHIANEQD